MKEAAKAFRRLKRRYMVRKEQLAALESQVAASKVTREASSSEELYDLYAEVLHFPTEIETEVDWLPRASVFERDGGKMVDAEFSSEVLELSNGEVQAHVDVTATPNLIQMFDSPGPDKELMMGVLIQPDGLTEKRVMLRWHAQSFLMAHDEATGLVQPESRVNIDISWDSNTGLEPMVRVGNPTVVKTLPGVLRGVLAEENETMYGRLGIEHDQVIK